MLHYEHLVRRGVEVVRDNSGLPEDVPPQLSQLMEAVKDMPQWGIYILVTTLLAGILLISSVRYTLQGVVMTLAMVESPQTTVLIRDEKPMKYDDAEESIDSEVLVIKQVPITSKIRSTIHHIQARAGFAARWRGLSVLLVWGFGYMVLKNVLTNLAVPFVGELNPIQFQLVAQPLAAVASRVLLTRLGLTWTHIVISEPSTKSWYSRIPNHKVWKKVAGPTLYTAAAWQMAYLMPAAVAFAVGLSEENQFSNAENAHCVAMKVLAVGGIALVTFVGITIPAEVALTRVQVSMLPEEDETIVPFDRTFGGAIRPEILGGSGKLGFIEAWATFDFAARIRLLKLYVKVFAVDVLMHMAVALVLIGELIVILAPKMSQIVGNDAPLNMAQARPLNDMAQARYEAVVLGS